MVLITVENNPTTNMELFRLLSRPRRSSSLRVQCLSFCIHVQASKWYRNNGGLGSDPSDEAISRAKFPLQRNGFDEYHVLENNCEDFAVCCKTGLVVGRSGQANSVSAVACVARVVSPWAGIAQRLCSDIGIRNDAIEVPAESLVARFNQGRYICKKET